MTLMALACIESLCSGRFHNHLRDVFAPHVVRYVDLMESSIAQSIHKGFEKESWKPQGSALAVSLPFLSIFYRAVHYRPSAERGLAITCRLSVCPSVTLVDHDHIG